MPSVKISYRNFHLNEFVANALLDNIGSKKQPLTSEKMRSFLVLNVKNIGSGLTIKLKTMKHNCTN